MIFRPFGASVGFLFFFESPFLLTFRFFRRLPFLKMSIRLNFEELRHEDRTVDLFELLLDLLRPRLLALLLDSLFPYLLTCLQRSARSRHERSTRR